MIEDNVYSSDEHLIDNYLSSLYDYTKKKSKKIKNPNFLVNIIQNRGLKQSYVANRLGISTAFLLKKCYDPMLFTFYDVLMLSDVLRCSTKMLVFYCFGFRIKTDLDKSVSVWDVKGLKLSDFDELVKLDR